MITQCLKKYFTYIEGFLLDYKPSNKDQGLALFSGGDELFEALVTHFTLPTLVSVDYSPYLVPLYDQIDDYERYLVIVADREKARYFTFHGDELEDEGEFFHEHVPQKMKGRNFEEREKQIDRHIQDHLHRHFKTISEKVVTYTRDRPITAVIVGGHQEIISYLYKHLPKSLSDKIIGEFPAEPDADFNELQKKSKEILQSLREKSHSQPSTNLNL